MKVVRIGKKSRPKEYTCDSCGSIISIEEDDWVNGSATCPVCGGEIYEDGDSKIHKYPDDFYDFSNGVDISNEKINKLIVRLIENVKGQNEPYAFAYSGTGNTIVFVFEQTDEDEYWIVVAKGYADCNVDRSVKWDDGKGVV